MNSTKRYSRIFLRNKENFAKIMNIFDMADGSVGMSFYGFEKEMLFGIKNNHRVNIEAINEGERPKISFHKSGIIKLMSKISNNETIDRITWRGTPFVDIREPRQMMEIILPPKLLMADHQLYRNDSDIILDATGFPDKQWRISLFCSSKDYMSHIRPPMVNTSEYEYSSSLEGGNLVWTWVLRVSTSHAGKMDTQEILYFVAGDIVHPK
ncbi:MAG: hypothetical protein WC490_03060 [Candidatus Margulisiibacteriota bacterium]